MALDAKELLTAMLNAMEPIIGKYWDVTKDYAKTESSKMGKTLALIESLWAKQKIDKVQAKALLEMQKQATQAVLLAIEGIGLICAQKAINAALAAIKTTVNKALGFALL